jgi:hypothetical protein
MSTPTSGPRTELARRITHGWGAKGLSGCIGVVLGATLRPSVDAPFVELGTISARIERDAGGGSGPYGALRPV